jgi:uncharacterized membrane protein
MKPTPFAAAAACLLAACESPTRSVDAHDLTAVVVRPASGPAITITALPSLSAASRANGINDAGTIVGSSVDAAGVTNAVKWGLAAGAWAVTQLPGGNNARATAINSGGDIVGVTADRAVIWPAAGGSIVLGCSEDAGPDVAQAINSAGMVAGYRNDASPPRAVVWRSGTCTDGTVNLKREDLPPLADGQATEARGIDDAGNVSGHAYDAAGDEWAVRWTFQNGAWAIQTLDAGKYAAAWAVNAAGDIAGSGCSGTASPPCQNHAMFWAVTGGKTDIGTLGGQTSAAFALSSAGELVGWSTTARQPSTRAFIWSASTGMRALAPLKRDDRSEAYGINSPTVCAVPECPPSTRQVVGFSSDRTGTQHAVVWTVP